MSKLRGLSLRFKALLVLGIVLGSALGFGGGYLVGATTALGSWSGNYFTEAYGNFTTGLRLPFTTSGRVLVAGSGGAVANYAGLIYDSTHGLSSSTWLNATQGIKDGALTSGRPVVAGAGGALTSSSAALSDAFNNPENTASYVMWGEPAAAPTIYYAKDGHTGAVTSNANAATLINTCINSLTSGRTWNEAIFLKGNITTTATLNVPSYTTIIINGEINVAANVVGIQLGTDTPDVLADYPRIYGGVIKGTFVTGNTHEGILSYSRHGIYDSVEVQEMGIGISIQENGLSCYENRLQNLDIHNNTWQGISIASGDNILSDCVSYYNDIGLYQNGIGGTIGTNIHLWSNRVGYQNAKGGFEYYTNFESESNTDNNLLIYASSGNIGELGFTNIKTHGTTGLHVHIYNSASYSVVGVKFMGGKIASSITVGSNVTAAGIQFNGVDITGAILSTVSSASIHNCLGYVDHNSGVAQLASNAWGVTINHGLSFTPQLKNIKVTPVNGTAGIHNWYVVHDSITSIQFQIGVGEQIASNAGYAWSIDNTP